MNLLRQTLAYEACPIARMLERSEFLAESINLSLLTWDPKQIVKPVVVFA
jgi:hypothetical protein